MRILLDTHTFLWWIENSPQLSQTARDIILSDEHTVYLSAASSWEISIKAHIGRLLLPDTPEHIFANAQAHYRFSVLPVQINHACRVFGLPNHHSDPFDRLLIAQCLVEDLVLLSVDEDISKYDVKVIW
jgi:PIN domain nuclease of toxin-antitoxin system